MSKATVGEVYAKVINEVCENSRQDFEEGGVELATLELLKAEWQKKLSGLKVTQLPWDPQAAPVIKEQPAPPPAKPVPQALPSNGNAVNTPTPPHVAPTVGSSVPRVKAENSPVYPPQTGAQQNYAVPSFPQGQPMTARERAAQQLHESYGQRAGAQIAQLQSNQRVPGQASAGSPVNYIKQEEGQSSLGGVQDYHAGAQPIQTSQTDGSADSYDDWDTEYARRKEFSRIHGARADRLIKDQSLAKQQQLEGGGLLTPLDERPSQPSAKRLGSVYPLQSGTSSKPSHLARAQGDATGDDDDDIDDEDAINSDLDDPDDLAANEGDEENTDQVMLCTYDKVQRVKNKWKCTLKDGVLRVDGNEYVFHKGQGEFEW
ncbi:hypothetical protein B0A52_04593 [Exophiala mesophila]|uniref:Transcription initiation factor IIA subunit 1 n=1 Tax=Exophiala mesophila TaxID=212818 RepID=A0A438N8C5_EXOME|nr:hypothetical protein B0A52_04593 [Exophiala mesophila]